MTDDYGTTTGSSHVMVSCNKQIIKSNDAPATEDEWAGFQRRFLVIQLIKKKQHNTVLFHFICGAWIALS